MHQSQRTRCHVPPSPQPEVNLDAFPVLKRPPFFFVARWVSLPPPHPCRQSVPPINAFAFFCGVPPINALAFFAACHQSTRLLFCGVPPINMFAFFAAVRFSRTHERTRSHERTATHVQAHPQRARAPRPRQRRRLALEQGRAGGLRQEAEAGRRQAHRRQPGVGHAVQLSTQEGARRRQAARPERRGRRSGAERRRPGGRPRRTGPGHGRRRRPRAAAARADRRREPSGCRSGGRGDGATGPHSPRPDVAGALRGLGVDASPLPLAPPCPLATGGDRDAHHRPGLGAQRRRLRPRRHWQRAVLGAGALRFRVERLAPR